MKKHKAIRGKVKLYYDEAGELQVEAKGAAKRALEDEVERRTEQQAEAERQAHIDSRNAEVQSYEERYRKSPRGPAISPDTPTVVADAMKKMPIQHGAVPVTSPLLQGESPKHTEEGL